MIPQRRGLLIVSLPRNDVALAAAAKAAGADALKAHLNVRHLASGTVFGTLAQERGRLEQILALGLPTGVVPGETVLPGPEELAELKRMGVAFLDVFVDAIRPHLLAAGIPVVPALPHSADDRYLLAARDMPGRWVEAAVVPAEGYGLPPAEADLAALRKTGAVTGKRLIVPTQRRIAPADVPRYFEIPEVAALMIGAIVTGTEPDGLHAAASAFRAALDALTSAPRADGRDG